ncbi:MAG: pyruvate formate lyase-activating protein [Ruminococcaceae bacterium]|nr:pyruvate formate lyase-activating protein [Oscillospiraceae bacterium]
MLKGCVNSIQSLGTLDGPGVRFVVFMQGCNLRCGCCHNPDTWEIGTGDEYSVDDVFEKCKKYKEYFGQKGGITLSGGEPLLQASFAKELFKMCKEDNINTCLDTSGSILNDDVKLLLKYTDRVLLDIKYKNDELYKKHVGCSINSPLNFLEYLNENNIPTTLRQVIIPSLNDDKENIEFILSLLKKYPCIDKTELLPFKKICKVKYDKMNLNFSFEKYDTPNKKLMEKLQKYLPY